MLAPPPLTEAQVRALAPEDVAGRGWDYWRAGAVREPVQQGPVLRAEVVGSRPEPYPVEIEFGPDGRPRYECDCPDFRGLPRRRRRPCKHIVALLLQWAHAPESFAIEAPIEALLAGPKRDALLAEIKNALREEPALAEVLAQPAEPGKGRPTAVNLDQVDRQISFALSRHRREPAVLHERLAAVLEQGVARIQAGDAHGAVQILTRLLARLRPLFDEDELEPERLVALARRTVDALELAALEAQWPAEERQRWLQELMRWWAEDHHGLADPLMDLILHAYRPEDALLVEGWLRELLRKPRHAAELTGRWWRERVLSFLLAFYEGTGRHQAFLDLCWEEDKDARAALKFVEIGQVEEARRLARQGLGSAASHHALAQQLWERGETALALEVAEQGRRYADAWRPALLEWLAGRHLGLGEADQAQETALAAWREAPSLERYHLLAAAARQNERWPELRGEVQAGLEERGETGLLVRILLDENELRAAAALLPSVEPAASREALTLAVAEALQAAGRTADAVPLSFDAAELIIAGRTRAHYARAAELLARVRQLASGEELGLDFDEKLRALLERYRRRRALLEELERALDSAGVAELASKGG